MATVKIEATGLRCPQPVLKISAMAPKMGTGDILEVSGDCPTFEADVRKWCDRMKKTLLSVQVIDTAKVVQIQF